jgi:hypothetical protein
VAQGLRFHFFERSYGELNARIPPDRRHVFAADRCLVTWPHGRRSVYSRGAELEAQIGSLNKTKPSTANYAGPATGRFFMPLVQLVVVLIVVGVLLGMVNRYIPMAGSIKSILNGVVVISVVLWLLNVFGLFSSISAIHVGKLTWLGATLG